MILVDYSQYSLAAFFVNYKNNKGLEKDLNFLRHIILSTLGVANRKFRSEYGELVLCCESRSNWRRAVFPYYKAKRREDRKDSSIDFDSLFTNIGIIRNEIIDNTNFIVISEDGAEADDVIGTLSKLEDQKILILSSDKDFIQLHNDNVSQYDNKNNRWVKSDNPKKYLFEHILRGDAGDGIPNVLSDDDTFVNDKKRQKQMRSTRLEDWWKNGIDYEIVDKDKLKRNLKLVDLSKTPKDLQQNILNTYRSYDRTLRSPSKYFMKNKLSRLTDSIGDFK